MFHLSPTKETHSKLQFVLKILFNTIFYLLNLRELNGLGIFFSL